MGKPAETKEHILLYVIGHDVQQAMQRWHIHYSLSLSRYCLFLLLVLSHNLAPCLRLHVVDSVCVCVCVCVKKESGEKAECFIRFFFHFFLLFGVLA